MADVTPTPKPRDSLKDSLFKSLSLAVDDEGKVTSLPERDRFAQTPDSGDGVKKPEIGEFDPSNGSLAEFMQEYQKTNPTDEPATSPVEPVATPAATVPPVTPAVAPVEPPKPEVKVPEIKIDKTEFTPPVKPVSVDALDIMSGMDTTGLDEEEIDEVASAAFAEQKYPSRYPGHAKKILNWIKQHKQFVSQRSQEIPEEDLENDSKYKAYVAANSPKVSPGERRKIERERLIDEATKQAEAKMSVKQQAMEQELYKLRVRPNIDKTVKDFSEHVEAIMPAEDDALVNREKKKVLKDVVNAGAEFLKLSTQVETFVPTNPTHKWLADFIEGQGDAFVKSGHEALKRGKQSFVTRAQYNTLGAGDRAKHFTFTDEEVMQLLALEAKRAVEYTVKERRKELEELGYSKSTPTRPPVAPVIPVPATPENSPRATVTMAPTNAPVGAVKKDPFMAFITR